MAQYLDKVAGTLRKRQAEQVVKLLNEQKNAGQIRTLQDFTTRLDTLIRELNQTVMTPTTKIFAANINQTVDSDTFNFSLDRVQDDLESAFEECNAINEVQSSHETVVRDLILENIKFGIAELESKLALYEFLNKDPNGFDMSLFSTFRESKKERSSRDISQGAFLFTDPRTGIDIPVTRDAFIDPVGERLVLSIGEKTNYKLIRARQIFDASCPQSAINVQPPNLPISNIVDGTFGTYWVQTLICSTLTKSVKVKIEITIDGVRDINFLEIEPAIKIPLYLESIDYVDTDSTVVNATKPEILFTSDIGVTFPTITTDRIILTFRNENGFPLQFSYPKKLTDTLFYQSFLQTQPDMANLAPDLKQILSSIKTQDLINLGQIPTSPASAYVQINGNEFTTGFDNIRVGITDYDDIGIYVSTPLIGTSIHQLGLRASETRSDGLENTNLTYDVDDSTNFNGSIEYWIIKRDLDNKNNILSSSRFPILPMGITRINNERLVLTEKSDADRINKNIGQTIFFTDKTLGDVKVYRNGIELDFVPDEDTIADGWYDITEEEDKTPNSRSPMRFRIKLQNVNLTDILTVSYTPMTSNTVSIPLTLSEFSDSGLSVVDLIGDLSARVLENQMILLEQSKDDRVTKSEVFLQIILRSNTSDTRFSPAIEEYLLVAGQTLEDKFRGFNE